MKVGIRVVLCHLTKEILRKAYTWDTFLLIKHGQAQQQNDREESFMRSFELLTSCHYSVVKRTHF
jgi:hypothetical protein